MHYVKMAIGALVIGTALALAGCPTMDGSMKSDSGSMGSGDSMKSKSGMGNGGGYAFDGVAGGHIDATSLTLDELVGR